MSLGDMGRELLPPAFRPVSEPHQPPDSSCPGQEAPGNPMEVELWLLIIFLYSQVLTSAQVAPCPSHPPHRTLTPSLALCWAWGHRHEADTAPSPQGTLSLLISMLRNDPQLFSMPSTSQLGHQGHEALLGRRRGTAGSRGVCGRSQLSVSSPPRYRVGLCRASGIGENRSPQVMGCTPSEGGLPQSSLGWKLRWTNT